MKHEHADLALGQLLAALGVDDLGQEVVLVDVRAVALLDALARDARADHLGEAVGVGRAHAEAAVDLGPHRLRPRLGADDREAQADLVGPDAALLELLRERERIARRAGDDVRAEVGDQQQLPLRHAARDRHDGHAEPLGAVVEPEAAGEQPVAEARCGASSRARRRASRGCAR